MVVLDCLNTIRERPVSDACHAVWDCDGCQAATSFERIVSDACHAVGYGDGNQDATPCERTASDANYSIGRSIPRDRFGNGDRTLILVIPTCDGCSILRQIIVDAVDLAVVGGSSECEEGKGDKDC